MNAATRKARQRIAAAAKITEQAQAHIAKAKEHLSPAAGAAVNALGVYMDRDAPETYITIAAGHLQAAARLIRQHAKQWPTEEEQTIGA